MENAEYQIFKIFIKHSKVNNGDCLSSDALTKETDISLQELYELADSLEQKGLIKIKNFSWPEEGSKIVSFTGFELALTKEGENFI